jgi:UDP-N-acetyl-D-mannosaminuronic acid dehydrogenase
MARRRGSSIRNRINGKENIFMSKYDICVIGGCGHVGLPLAILFAAKGKNVVIYDLHEESIRQVSEGKMPFLEEGAEEVLKKVVGKNLHVSSDKSVIGESKFVIVVIGTPADRYLNPEFSKFRIFFQEIIGLLHDDQHVILRSTVFPGTTEKVIRYLKEEGKATRVTFCPERILQGKAMEELCSLPQIIGAHDEAAADEAKELFSILTRDILFLSPMEAEFAKLFTNIWRYIQFASGNQFYQIATEQGLDFYKIHHAITHNYPRCKDFVKAGFAAGPCLFKDTAHMVAHTGNSFFLGSAAILVNEGLPNFIVQKLRERHKLEDKAIGILGMAFKANIDDKRESLAFKLKKILEMEAKKVLCSDAFIRRPDFVPSEDLIRDSDIIIVGAPHSQYSRLKIGDDKVLVDVWNFFGKGGSF